MFQRDVGFRETPHMSTFALSQTLFSSLKHVPMALKVNVYTLTDRTADFMLM